EPQIRAAGSARRGRARPLSRPDLRRQGRQHLARERRRTVSPERRDPEIPTAASDRPPGSVCGKDLPERSGPVQVSDRRTRRRRHIHGRRTWLLGGAAQDLDPRAFLVQLALPDGLLIWSRRITMGIAPMMTAIVLSLCLIGCGEGPPGPRGDAGPSGPKG